MEPVCRALWRGCASHWRGVSYMVVSVTRHRTPSSPRECPCTAAMPASLPRRARVCPPAAAMPASLPRRGLSAGQSSCWGCQAVLSRSELFCPSCRCLQPPDPATDYFQLLHCDRSFDVNIQELQKKYRNLQRSLHPDYFSQKSQYERDISDQQSSLVNKAYNTLLSPLKRGIYLLGLHGITFTEETEGGMDAPFLMEILEINERLNEADTDAEIEAIGTFVQDKCQSLIENVREAFQKDDLEGAKMFLSTMKYYTNILDKVKKKILP